MDDREAPLHAEVEELLKWERSLTVAVWEKKPVVADRYRRGRDTARQQLDNAIRKLGGRRGTGR